MDMRHKPGINGQPDDAPGNIDPSQLKEQRVIWPDQPRPATRHKGSLSVGRQLLILVVIIVGVTMMNGKHDQPIPSASTPEATPDTTAWKTAVYSMLRDHMRDPDSLLIESYGTPTPAYSNKGPVTFSHVYYRARNGFGGMNREEFWVARLDETKNYWFLRDDEWDSWKRKVHFSLTSLASPSPTIQNAVHAKRRHQ